MKMTEWDAASFDERMAYLRSLKQNKDTGDKFLEIIAAQKFPGLIDDIPYKYYSGLASHPNDPDAYVSSRREAREVAAKKGHTLL